MGRKIAQAFTEEISQDQLRWLTNKYDATVVTNDGRVGEASGITKADAIRAAARKAGVEDLDD